MTMAPDLLLNVGRVGFEVGSGVGLDDGFVVGLDDGFDVIG